MKKNKFRAGLCEALADAWRVAENLYLESNYADSSFKWAVKDIQDACSLSEEETKTVERLADAMGV